MTIGHAAQALISADAGFGAVSGLTWIDPASPEVDRFLAAVPGE